MAEIMQGRRSWEVFGQVLNPLLDAGELLEVRVFNRVDLEDVLVGKMPLDESGYFKIDYTEGLREYGLEQADLVLRVADEKGEIVHESGFIPNAPDLARVDLNLDDRMRSPDIDQSFELPSLPTYNGFWDVPVYVNPERNSNSIQAIHQFYKTYLEGQDDPHYSWRLGINSATKLPQQLRIRWEFDRDMEAAQREARDLLASSNLSPVLFGDLESRPDNWFDNTWKSEPPIQMGGEKEERRLRHFYWRQTYNYEGRLYPVLGGSVRIHEAIGSNRTYITSSYLPVEDDPDLPEQMSLDISLDDAAINALWAVLSVVQPKNKALLVQTLIEEWTTRRIPPLAVSLTTSIQKMMARLGMQLGAFGAKADHPIQRRWVQIRDGSHYAIVPYQGKHYLIARLQVVMPEEAPWYVDVEMAKGDIIGVPWQRRAHASVYLTSQGMADSQTSTIPDNEITSLIQPIAYFGLPDGDSVEANTVKYHMGILYDHLINQCGLTLQLPASPLVPVQIQFNSDGGTYFDYDGNEGFSLIRMRTGNQTVDGKTIRSPARDPEVITHELVHALLWGANAAPWDHPSHFSPFGRALQEGYAVYLARSLAAADDVAEIPKAWARGAYGSDWGDDWRLARTEWNDGADYLRVPNRYPKGQYSFAANSSDPEFRDYQVGMIWARFLWDLRQLLGRDQADRLAVQAYGYLHGHISSFELAAEGLIHAASALHDIDLSHGILPLLGHRGIAAGQGIQAFGSGPTGTLIAAGEEGLFTRQADGSWQLDQALQGLVGVAMKDDILYAVNVALPPSVTVAAGAAQQWQSGVFFLTGNNVWEPLGHGGANFPAHLLPLCMRVLDDKLFVGTNRGLYYFDDSSGWQQAASGTAAIRNAEIQSLALWPSPNGNHRLIACTPSEIPYLRVNGLDQGWTVRQIRQDPLRLTETTVWNNKLWVGTVGDGLWARDDMRLDTIGNHIPGVDDNIVAVAGISSAEGSVQNPFVCASNDSIYKTEDGQSFTQHPFPIPTARILSLGLQAGSIWVGTLAHGIWQLDDQGIWTNEYVPPMGEQQILAGRTVTLVSFFQELENGAVQIAVPDELLLQTVAQPDTPLRIVASVGGFYHLKIGWVVLAVKNRQQATVALTLQKDSNGNVILAIQP